MSKYFSSLKYHFNLADYVHGESDYWESDVESTENIPIVQPKQQDHQNDKMANSSGDEDESSQDHKGETSMIQKRNEFLSKYLDLSSDEDSDREGGSCRIVKSQKQKRAQELEGLLQSARDNFEANAWPKAQADMEKLSRMIFKSAVSQPDREEIGDLLDLAEEFEISLKGILAESEKEESSASSAKAFNALRQQTKKILREINEQFGHLFQEEQQQQQQQTGEASSSISQKPAKLDSDEILKRVDEILQQRAKKGADSAALIGNLKEMLPLTSEEHIKVRIFVAILAIAFEYNANAHSCLPLPAWKQCFEHLELLVQKLQANCSTIRMQEKSISSSTVAANGEENVHLVKGNLTSLLVMLDDEFCKSFLFANPFSDEYAERMQLEQKLLVLLQQAREYFTRISNADSVEYLALRMMEHLYWKSGELSQVLHLNESIKKPIAKTKRDLFILYSYSIHGKDQEASQLYHQLIEQRQEQQQQQQQRTPDLEYHQTLFHRCIVQFGLLKFSLGHFKEATELMMAIFNSSIKPKELIGQSFRQSVSHFTSTSYADKTAEERAERARQVPFHMHINLDNLEIVYFLLSFLVEAPLIGDSKKKTQGRGLKKAYEAMEKTLFSVPPTTPKEVILSAVSHFIQADWPAVEREISSLRIWCQFPQETLNCYLKELQVLFIRCYLHTNCLYYKSLCAKEVMKEMGIDSNEHSEFIQKLSNEFSLSSAVGNSSSSTKTIESSQSASRPDIDNLLPYSMCIAKIHE